MDRISRALGPKTFPSLKSLCRHPFFESGFGRILQRRAFTAALEDLFGAISTCKPERSERPGSAFFFSPSSCADRGQTGIAVPASMPRWRSLRIQRVLSRRLSGGAALPVLVSRHHSHSLVEAIGGLTVKFGNVPSSSRRC